MEESCCSIELLIVMLARFGVILRPPRNKIAQSLLQDFVGKVCNALPVTLLQDRVYKPLAYLPALCPKKGIGKTCKRCEGILEEVTGGQQACWPQLVPLILEVFGAWDQFKCNFALLWLKTLLQGLLQLLDVAWSPAKWSATPSGMSDTVTSRGRRRRLDEEVLRAHTPSKDGSQSSRPASLSSRKRRCQTLHAAEGDPWTNKAAMRRQVAAYAGHVYQTFCQQVQLNVCHDASMVAGDDTLLFAMWSHHVGKACWLPPQALGRILKFICQPAFALPEHPIWNYASPKSVIIWQCFVFSKSIASQNCVIVLHCSCCMLRVFDVWNEGGQTHNATY